jgi:hypothetical protein
MPQSRRVLGGVEKSFRTRLLPPHKNLDPVFIINTGVFCAKLAGPAKPVLGEVRQRKFKIRRRSLNATALQFHSPFQR